MGLTAKQQRFVEEYVVDFNATRAAIDAGYSENTARAIGAENLTKPDIAQAIARHTQTITRSTELTREAVVQGLMDITSEDDAPASARVRAWELLGKHLAMFTDKVQIEHMPDPQTVREWIDAMKADIDAVAG